MKNFKKQGDILRELRHSYCLSLAQLASKIGVSYQQVQKYEIGINNIPTRSWLLVMEALGISRLLLWEETLKGWRQFELKINVREEGEEICL